jgi:hypothetical protein
MTRKLGRRGVTVSSSFISENQGIVLFLLEEAMLGISVDVCIKILRLSDKLPRKRRQPPSQEFCKLRPEGHVVKRLT